MRHISINPKILTALILKSLDFCFLKGDVINGDRRKKERLFLFVGIV